MTIGRPAPLVSVVMANFRGAPHLSAAIASVLGQTLEALELIFSDDCSDDASVAIARDWAGRDDRVHVIEAPRNAGPGAARNRAIEAARGDWIAIVDSDDLVHPERMARLLDAARHLNADIVADDLVFFGDSAATCGRTLLQGLMMTKPRRVQIEDYLRANAGEGAIPALGYLKPFVRRAAIGCLRFHKDMRVGEDYDFCLRLLISGARMWLLPDPMYLYRRHSSSVSHRMSPEAAAGIIAGIDRLPAPASKEQARLRKRWRDYVDRQHRYAELVEALKARRLGTALPRLMDPAMTLSLGRSLMERLARTGRKSLSARRTPLCVALSESGDKAEPQRVGVARLPPIPEPGGTWVVPPAEFAAQLSSMWSRYDLTVTGGDDAGRWARWLVPSSYRFEATAEVERFGA